MSNESVSKLSRIVSWLCWMPVISLLMTEIYMEQFDGYGAWGAAPMLLLPAGLSLAIAPGVLREWFINRGWKSVLQIVVTLLPVIWLFIRKAVMS